MIDLIFCYFVGVVGVLIACYHFTKDEDITLGDVIKAVLLSLLSWITIIIAVMLVINDILESLLKSDKVIIHRKRKEK